MARQVFIPQLLGAPCFTGAAEGRGGGSRVLSDATTDSGPRVRTPMAPLRSEEE